MLRFSCYHFARKTLTGGIMIFICSDFGSRFFMLSLDGGVRMLLTLLVGKHPREEIV